MKHLAALLCLAAVLSACGGQPVEAPDLVSTQIAVEEAAHATMTARAPTATKTPTSTLTPDLVATQIAVEKAAHATMTAEAPTATQTPMPTPTSTPTEPPTPAPTWTPTEAPSAMALPPTPRPTKKAQAVATAKPAARRLLLFSSTERSEHDLYTMDERGGGLKQLTGIGRVYHAQFSPDGTRIAFDRTEGEHLNQTADIYVMNVDGSGLVNLTQSSDYVERYPAWSPDGKQIAFTGRRVKAIDTEVYIMNADGTERRLLVDINNVNESPTWSPDGKRLAFVGYYGGYGKRWIDESDIFVVNADGTGLENLSNRGEHFSNPIWSPDGNEFVYGRLTRAAWDDQSWQIWRMSAWGTDQRCLIGCVGRASDYSSVPVAWRGSKIAYRAWDGGDWDVFLANADGTGVVEVADTDADDVAWDWQP